MKLEPIELTFTGEFTTADFGVAFDEIAKQDGRREITLTFDSPEFRQRMEWYAQGFQLWREWFDKGDHPLIWHSMFGTYVCLFCGGQKQLGKPTGHAANCIYIRAKKLIEEADGVIE